MCEDCNSAWEKYNEAATRIMRKEREEVEESKNWDQQIDAMKTRREEMKSVDEFYERVKANCKRKG